MNRCSVPTAAGQLVSLALQVDSDWKRHVATPSSSSRHSGPDSEPGPSSVMELLRPEDRERLLSIRTASSVPAFKATPPVLPAGSPSVGGLASSGLQQEALAAWRGVQSSSQTFRPFEKNPSKQARYELYLNRLRQGDQGRRLLLQVPSCTTAHACQHVCSSLPCLVLARHHVTVTGSDAVKVSPCPRRPRAEPRPGPDGVGAQQGAGGVRPGLHPVQTQLLLAVLTLHQSQTAGGRGQRGGGSGPGGASVRLNLQSLSQRNRLLPQCTWTVSFMRAPHRDDITGKEKHFSCRNSAWLFVLVWLPGQRE